MINDCNNRPRPVAGKTHVVQVGWITMRDRFGHITREAVWRDQPHVMSTDCKYDASHTDPGCFACVHQPQRSRP